MTYYRGDYYAGGLGSFLFGGLKSAVGLIPGVGPLAQRALSAIPTGVAKSGAVASAAGAGMAIVKAGAGAARTAIIKHPVVSAVGAAGIAAGAGALGEHMLMAPGAAALARGHHMSKPYKCHGAVVPSHLVRNRRMNPCNVRALRRASRRAHAFLRISRRLVGHFVGKKPKGRAFVKKSKSKK